MTPEIKELEKQIWLLRRDYFVENLFIPDYLKADYDPGEDYQIWVVDGLEQQFIALVEDHWDTPCRIWVNKDGSVYVGSCDVGSNGAMMPTCDIDQGCWYDGDEIQQVGQIEIPYGQVWYNMMGEIKVLKLNVSAATQQIIEHTYMADLNE